MGSETDARQPDFKALFEAAPGLCLILTPELLIAGASEAYVRASMTRREEIIGRHIFEVFPDNPDDPNANGVANLKASLERVLRLKQPNAFAHQKYDVRRPDGVFEEHYWSPLNTPVLDETGEVAWIIHFVEDVTDVVRLEHQSAQATVFVREQQRIIDKLHAAHETLAENEKALRAGEERFRSIFSAISEGIFMIGPATGRIVEVNEPGSVMFGYAPGEMVGLDIEAISSGEPPYTQSDALAWIERAAVSGLPQRFDWRCKTKDGQLFWAEISVRFASIGGRRLMLAIVHDLTERQAIESQLQQAQKMEAIGQLTGGLAHDFNNLLGVIIGNLDLLREARPGDGELAELSGDALDAALRGADLTRRLLAFARRQPLQPQRIDPMALISGTVKLLSRVIGENIEISVRFADDVGYVLADPAQLEAALTNLATNARDAMPRGGKLSITAARRWLDADYAAANRDVAPGDYAMIEVTDTGEGMSPEVISRVFEPFYTTKGRDQGTGLGLSMVFGFLKQSGGHVSVYSEVGVGTTFRLYLPRLAVAEDLAATAPPTNLTRGQGQGQGQGETVLVVEDNVPLRRVAVRELRSFGYRVIEASNGAGALAQLEAGPAHVLFTDVVMPGDLDGFELARIAAQRWPEMKVILTSGFPKTGPAADLGAANLRLLAKPYRKADLVQAVREVLDDTSPAETNS
jgi:PAS domain S-box-containing protein